MSNKPINDLWEAYKSETLKAHDLTDEQCETIKRQHHLITNKALRWLSDLVLADLKDLPGSRFVRFGKFLKDTTKEISELLEKEKDEQPMVQL